MIEECINSMSSRFDTTVLRFPDDQLLSNISDTWKGCAIQKESSLHQISPYIGKMKSSMASTLISSFTRQAETIYDPFCGSGTVALEAWTAGRNVIANDLSPYAFALTQAKLSPCLSVEDAFAEIDTLSKQMHSLVPTIDLRKIPKWVRSFYHPDTLREIVAWSKVLVSRKSYFLLSCLLGILHHQRPGFLSYPSSHTVPYLREKNFPQDIYPELYQYRPVQERLKKKAQRALKRVPLLDPEISRKGYMRDAAKFVPEKKVNAIITSPPYMRQLDYARDNRLRQWFLGVQDWKLLDKTISPSEEEFLKLFRSCLKLWRNLLSPKGLCILVLGDTHSRIYDLPLPDIVARIAIHEIGGYSVLWKYTEQIPNDRRVRRGYRGNLTETVLVLCNNKGN